MPCPARQPVSGPCKTDLVQWKCPPDWAKSVPGTYAPPPVRVTVPVGKPAMSVLLKPKASRACAAAVGAPTSVPRELTKPASTISTAAHFFIAFSSFAVTPQDQYGRCCLQKGSC